MSQLLAEGLRFARYAAKAVAAAIAVAAVALFDGFVVDLQAQAESVVQAVAAAISVYFVRNADTF